MNIVADISAAVHPRTVAVDTLCCLAIDVGEAACVRSKERSRPSAAQVSRLAAYLDGLALLLERSRSRATFFVSGELLQALRSSLVSLRALGCEVAYHGTPLEPLGTPEAQKLRDALRRDRGLFEDELGVAPRGFRAPAHSLTHDTAWALDVLIQEGLHYDASLMPAAHGRSCLPEAPVGPFWAVAPSGARILEFPPLTVDSWLGRLPVGDAEFSRWMPSFLVDHFVQRAIQSAEPVLLSLQPRQARDESPAEARQRGCAQGSAGPSLARAEHLLEAFAFDTIERVLEAVRAGAVLPRFVLQPMI